MSLLRIDVWFVAVPARCARFPDFIENLRSAFVHFDVWIVGSHLFVSRGACLGVRDERSSDGQSESFDCEVSLGLCPMA